MREPVIERFPKAPGLPRNVDACMKRVAEAYVIDAYPSLSIEGYRVTTDLIQRVRRGVWNPEKNDQDRDQRSAMAAPGYWQAYQEVQKSIAKVLGGENAGAVEDDDHRTWYLEMFAPSVTADILKPSDLAPRLPGLHSPVHARAPEPRGGERCHAGVVRTAARGGAPDSKGCARALCIRVHPSLQGRERAPGAVSDEPHDGAGGYPWTVIPVMERKPYMESLERASVGEDIRPFVNFLASLVKQRLAGEPLPAVPKAPR